MKEEEIKIAYRICQPEELPANYQDLITLAKETCKTAYAPYSNFQVGAAVLLENGEIVAGNNQENVAYPSGLCAERVALFYANSRYPNNKVKAIAIAAFTDNDFTMKPITPCGACRQVISETESRFNSSIEIVLYGKNEVLIIKGATSLLPFQFSM